MNSHFQYSTSSLNSITHTSDSIATTMATCNGIMDKSPTVDYSNNQPKLTSPSFSSSQPSPRLDMITKFGLKSPRIDTSPVHLQQQQQQQQQRSGSNSTEVMSPVSPHDSSSGFQSPASITSQRYALHTDAGMNGRARMSFDSNNNNRTSLDHNSLMVSRSNTNYYPSSSQGSSSTSLPLAPQRSSIASAKLQNISIPNVLNRSSTSKTITPQQQQLRQSQQSQVKQSRNSISSQISLSSRENSIRRVSTSGFSHRTSFSFSRRRSLIVPQHGITNVQHLEDGSASAQDIERLRDAIVSQREQKRRRREFIEDERVLVGTKVSEGHVNYVTAYNMLTGIRVSVSRCNAKVNHELADADFDYRYKLAFDISGNELTPSARYDFKFKDYAPWVFRHLRELFKLDPADYLMSLTSKYLVSELGSPGKSGSFFYFSRDYKYIIKTIHHSEHKMLRKILKDYYNHVKNNPNTLISQFYGLHRVKLPFGRKIHFIVMNNLFPPHRDIHQTYDLKGSTLGRYLPEVNTGDEKARRRSVVYKDLNWINHHQKIKLGPIKRAQFIDQLKIDVDLLKRLNIMDYSLLIGIHDLNKGNTENIRDATLSVFEPDAKLTKAKVKELRKALNAASPIAFKGMDFVFDEYMRRGFTFYGDNGGLRSTNEHNEPLNEIYYLGVIDCLTPYTFSKRIETFVKGLSHSKNSLSAIPALDYGDRFFKFIKSVITSSEQNKPILNKVSEESEAPEPSTTHQQAQQEDHLPALSEASSEVRDN